MPRYSPETKLEAQRLIEQEGKSLGEVAKLLGPDRRTIQTWKTENNWIRRVDDLETEERMLRNRIEAQDYATKRMLERLQTEATIYEKSTGLLKKWLDFIDDMGPEQLAQVFASKDMVTRMHALYAASSRNLESAANPHLDQANDGRELRITVRGVNTENLS